MPNTRYRRGRSYAADMAVYTRQMAGDNSREISQLKRNLIRALREDVTEKQRQVLLLYYAEGYNMREIGEKLGVDKSTISRTISAKYEIGQKSSLCSPGAMQCKASGAFEPIRGGTMSPRAPPPWARQLLFHKGF